MIDFESFQTCDICDTVRSASPQQTVRVLPPLFHHYGKRQRFYGPVRTAKCFEDNSPVKALVESKGNNAVLVVDGGASLRRALLGGNLATAAARNGWAGLVIDGCVRDIKELRSTEVGVCALHAIPMPSHRTALGQIDVPLVIQGVVVNVGDWLYADEDGIVICTQAQH